MQVSGGVQGTSAVAGRPTADSARAPRTAVTPRIRFIRRTSSVAASNAAVRRSGSAVKRLDGTPRVMSRGRLAGDPALAVHLVIVARRNRRVRRTEQAAERPARALRGRHVEKVGTAVERHVAREASLARVE